MHDFLDQLAAASTHLFQSEILYWGSLLFWGYGLFYLVTLITLYGVHTSKVRQHYSWAGFCAYAFPKHIYQHASFREDLYLFAFQSTLRLLFKTLTIISTLMLAQICAEQISAGLQNVFDSKGLEWVPAENLRFVYFLGIVLAADFGNFLGHYLLHHVPFLWEFHKVHHSAVHLTPITQFRAHPVEPLIRHLGTSLCMGTLMGLGAFVFTQVPQDFFIDTAVFLLVYNLTVHLRHSHLWVSFGPILSYIFISPAQHQIHHSIEPRHLHKNIGIMFSFWDLLFGCLYVPQDKEDFRIGLTSTDEHKELEGFWHLLWVPIVNAYKRLKV